MKTPFRTTLATLATGALAIGLAFAQDTPKKAEPKAQADAPAPAPVEPPKPAPPKPDLEPKGFNDRLLRDDTEVPEARQMSFAPVVKKILPSVVTIISSGGKSEEMPDVADIPPQLRPFFYRFFGNPDGSEDGAEEAPNPRRRGNPNMPRQMPRPQQRGVGSGFVISTDGYIMTNSHVVADAEKIEVTLETNGSGHARKFLAKVVGTDPLSDVALIKIDATDLPQATIGDSSKLQVGDVVLAAGAPMELNRSITQGIVSALGRSGMGIVSRGRMAGYEDFIQTDASINPGNSGGPLVDAAGRVVGINTAILSRSGMNAGIGFAIPINMALHIVEDLIDDGTVQRGFLGIQIRDLDEDQAEALGIKDVGGALVAMVGGDSPAERAGLEVGDVVTGINGQRVENSTKLRLIVSNNRPGSEISLEVLRDGKPVTLTAKLEALPSDAMAQNDSEQTLPKSRSSGTNSADIVPGVTVQNLTPAVRQRYDIPEDVTGVIVTKVDTESRAAAVGVEEGDVITQVNRKPVRAVGEAREMAKGGSKTVVLKVYRKGDTMLFMVSTDSTEE